MKQRKQIRRKSRWVKLSLLLVVLCGCIVAGPLIGLIIVDAVRNSYKECEPKELLGELESRFNITFPQEVVEFKTATTTPVEGDILFIVTFCGNDKTLERFFGSFPKTDGEMSIDWDYVDSGRVRKNQSWPPLGWLRQAIEIQTGKIGEYTLGDRRMIIYVDTTNKENCVVYIKGFFRYRTSAA